MVANKEPLQGVCVCVCVFVCVSHAWLCCELEAFLRVMTDIRKSIT